jgi:hypothetical protein
MQKQFSHLLDDALPSALFKLPQNWAASSVDPNGPTIVR